MESTRGVSPWRRGEGACRCSRVGGDRAARSARPGGRGRASALAESLGRPGREGRAVARPPRDVHTCPPCFGE